MPPSSFWLAAFGLFSWVPPLGRSVVVLGRVLACVSALLEAPGLVAGLHDVAVVREPVQ